MDKRALLTIATIVACRQHHEAAPSSTETTAPLSSSAVAVAEPLGGVASAEPSAAPHLFADAAARDPHIERGHGVLALLGSSDAGLSSIFGSGDLGELRALDGGDLGFGGGLGTIGIGRNIGTIDPAATPSLRLGALTVVGSLAPEVVRRIVRRNFGRFRSCYENGLRTNPALAGGVSTKIVVAKDGSVSSAQNGGSDLPDASVVQCVVRAFSSLVFPQPEGGGIVIVTAPLRFSPASK